MNENDLRRLREAIMVVSYLKAKAKGLLGHGAEGDDIPLLIDDLGDTYCYLSAIERAIAKLSGEGECL